MTNRFMQEKWSWIEGVHMMRIALLDLVTDADLAFNPGGHNMTLGGVWREIGEIEYAYITSLKTFKTDFAYRNTEAGLDTSVTRLKAWLQAQDDNLKVLVSALSDDDLKKLVGRSAGNSLPVETQLEAYLQALFIFFGKTVIYFKAMNKPLPQSVQDYIA